MFIYHSPSKRSFRRPGGGRGLDLKHGASICVLELAPCGLPWSPGASRGLSWSPVYSVISTFLDTQIQNSKLGRGSGRTRI